MKMDSVQFDVKDRLMISSTDGGRSPVRVGSKMVKLVNIYQKY